MKRMIIGLLLTTSINAFSAEKRIECMTENKKIHVALVGSNETFDLVHTLTIINGSLFGRDIQVRLRIKYT